MGSRLIEHRHFAGRHVVDQLIEERAPTLVQRPAGRWLLRNLLYPWLGYRAAKAAIDSIQGMSGTAIMAHAEAQIGMRVRVLGRSRLPAKGRLVIAVNHPTGLADGIALWSALSPVRADLRILANQDALRIAPALAEVFIPVDWVVSRRTPAGSRRVLAEIGRALRGEAALVFFPSGRIAHLRWRGLTERIWLPTVVTVARRFGAPIVPLHIRGRNSALFYLLSLLSRELRDVTLFHELLNKRGQRFELIVGTPLDPADLPDDPATAVSVSKRRVEIELPRASRTLPRIGSGGQPRLAGVAPPAP